MMDLDLKKSYKVISADSADGLNSQLTAAQKEGWRPTGEPSVIITPIHRQPDGYNTRPWVEVRKEFTMLLQHHELL